MLIVGFIMSMGTQISTSLDSLSNRIASINDPSQADPVRFVIIQSELEALGKEITGNEANLTYLDRFVAIQDQLRMAQEASPKQSADSHGMGSHLVSLGPPNQLASSFQATPNVPLPPGAQSTLGSINQWSDRNPLDPIFSMQYRNTCPCTSLAFVSRFLNHGNAGLDSNMVDNVIRIGQDRYLDVIAQRQQTLGEVEIPPELIDSVRGTMLSTVAALGAFEAEVGPRPPSPDAFVLKDLDPRMEGRLTGGLNQLIIDEAMRQRNGKIVIPLKVNARTFHTLFEVTGDEIKSSLCTPEGVPFSGTQSCFPNNPRGIAETSKALIGLMTTECRKSQLADFINKSLVPLTDSHPSHRVASTITINGQIIAIGIEATGSKENPTIKVTLFDSHGNATLNGSAKGFVYQVDGVHTGADILLRMMLVKDKEIAINGGLSEEQMKMIQGSIEQINEVGFCVILPRETPPFFAASPTRDRAAGNVGPQIKKEHSAPLKSFESPSSVNQDSQLEKKLAVGLEKSILSQALAQPDGRIIIPITMKEHIHHVFFEVTSTEIKSSLYSQEGAFIPNRFPNNKEGIAMTSKALIGLMIAELRK